MLRDRLSSSRRRVLGAGFATGASLVAGCSPFTLLNPLVPTGGYRITRDIAYGEHPRQRLDVYQPLAKDRKPPVIVFFYGGNWNQGERGNYHFVGQALASAGFAAVLPDYRLYPEVRFPTFLLDCAAAVRWTLDETATFGAGRDSLYLMGHSAGAYNATMLALNGDYLRGVGVATERLTGVIGLAGPYDFLPLRNPISRAVFGYPNTPVETQPIQFASAAAPRMLLAAGSADDVVDPANTTRLAARLRAVGAHPTVVFYPGAGHSILVGALAAPLRAFAPVLDDVARFVNG